MIVFGLASRGHHNVRPGALADITAGHSASHRIKGHLPRVGQADRVKFGPAAFGIDGQACIRTGVEERIILRNPVIVGCGRDWGPGFKEAE